MLISEPAENESSDDVSDKNCSETDETPHAEFGRIGRTFEIVIVHRWSSFSAAILGGSGSRAKLAIGS